MKYPRRGKNVRKPTVKKVVKKAIVKAKNQSIAKVVKRVLARQDEVKTITKSVSYVNVPCVIPTSTSIVGNYTVINPSNSSQGYTIAQGTNNAQRIGNKISLKKCIFDYVVQPKAYDATSNTVLYPFVIRFWLFKNRLNPTQDPTVAQMQTNFFENGATMTGLTGNVMDLNRKLCPETFTYLAHWDHKIGFGANNQNGNNAFQHNANNDFKMFARGTKDLTKFCPKQQIWDDNAFSTTTEIILFWNIYSMGPSAYPLTQFPCFISSNINYSYTDA